MLLSIYTSTIISDVHSVSKNAVGGWGINIRKDGNQYINMSGTETGTDINRLSLLTVIKAFERIKENMQPSSELKIAVTTDSEYIFENLVTMFGKRDSGDNWFNADREFVANPGLWREFVKISGIKLDYTELWQELITFLQTYRARLNPVHKRVFIDQIEIKVSRDLATDALNSFIAPKISCDFCGQGCTCGNNGLCSYCETHRKCDICGQAVCKDTAIKTRQDYVSQSGQEIYVCPECFGRV